MRPKMMKKIAHAAVAVGIAGAGRGLPAAAGRFCGRVAGPEVGVSGIFGVPEHIIAVSFPFVRRFF